MRGDAQPNGTRPSAIAIRDFTRRPALAGGQWHRQSGLTIRISRPRVDVAEHREQPA
jgi:hypothetical protein